jgi:sentrin-specific protease 7
MVELSDTDEAARSQQSAKATIGPKDAPPINLRQGFANIRASRNERKETEEEKLAEVGEFMQKNNKFKAKKSVGRNERQPQQRRHIQQPDEPEPEDFRSNVQAGQKSPRLQHTFVRDSLDETDPSHPKRPRTTAAQRLREQSEGRPKRVSPIDDGSSSPDVLNGEATIKSPQKEHHQTHHGNRSASPSDIRPTQFTKGTRVTRTKTAKKQSLKEEEATFEATTIAIRAFFATSCIATSGLIELRYDSKHKQLELLIEGSTREIPSGGSVVAIGGRDVDKVMWHNGHTNRKVVLKGPAGNLSNGHVCLVFRRYEDVDWFLQRIDDITDHNHTREALDHEKLEKSFMFLGSAIQYRAQQLEIQRTREENLLLAAEKRGILKGNQHQQEDDERIRYEGEDDESNPKPKKTRAKTLREVLLSQEATGHERYGLNDNDRGVDTLHSSPYFQATEHSTRSRRPALRPRTPPPVKWTVENQPERWSRSVVYPQEGQRRVTVDFQDLERLDEGEFLNDNVISFALRQIEENISAEHKQSVHFFNTFFYTALTTKNGKKVFNYDAVKRWTKNIDLLSVPYIVVPININLHWFVAIICNLPSLGRKAAMLEDEDEQDKIDDHVTTDAAEPSAVPIVDAVAADVDPGRPIAAGREEALGSDDLAGDSGQHENEVSQSTDAMDHLSLAENLKSPRRTTRSSSQKSNSTGRKSKKKPPPPPRKYASDLPAIITLDSFGSQHSTETRYLKDYICAEAEDKRAIIVERNDIIGMTTKGIPEQTNFCDCGVYLVGYVEEFAKDPRSFVTKVLNKELDKEADFATFDPSAKRTQIRDMLLELQQQQEAEHKAKKAVKKGAAAPKPDGAALHAGLEDPKKDENSSATQKISTAREVDAVPESTALTSEQPSLQAQYGSDPNGNNDEQLEMEVPRALVASRKSDTRKADDENHEMLDNCTDGDKGKWASSPDSLGSKDDLLDPLARSVRHGLTDSASPSSPVTKTERRRSPVVVVDLDVERTEIPDSQERLQTGGPSHIFFD